MVKWDEDRLMIIPDTNPNLEELELHTNCNITLHIDSSLPLQSLLVIAAGFLHLDEMQYGGRPSSIGGPQAYVPSIRSSTRARLSGSP